VLSALVVDDELGDCQAMAKALEAEGYSVFQAANAIAALGVADRQDQPMDMLVTDISLPGTNGCELARQLLKRWPGLKVLFVSGHVGAEVCQYYGIPVTDLFFLRKPFQSPELVERVRRVWESTDRLPLMKLHSDSKAAWDRT
jgi:two-component system, cell cycle sensor histidine kinase and response regulator CckA